MLLVFNPEMVNVVPGTKIVYTVHSVMKGHLMGQESNAPKQRVP